MSELRNDHIFSLPQDIDWHEALGEDCEGWQYFEAVECDSCDEIVVMSCDEERHDYLPGCEDLDCTSMAYASGPMMGYWYPVNIFKPEEAAKKIAHLPLCVVVFDDGRTGLALTCEGMDFSWEICAAYVALGYLPPLQFCDLPSYDRKDSDTQQIIDACIETCTVIATQAQCSAKLLEKTRDDTSSVQ